MIAITKADSGNEQRARAAALDYRTALRILIPADAIWTPPVLTISARENLRLDELWAGVVAHRAALEAKGEFEAKRRAQDVGWMDALIEEGFREKMLARPEIAAKRAELEEKVRSGKMPPSVAADEILSALEHDPEKWIPVFGEDHASIKN
jgi:LAO/AO transport system kinase